jgi:hypothetical protein
MKKEDLIWGESHHGREHSMTLNCPNRECTRHGAVYLLEDRNPIAIGVVSSWEKSNRPYILTCECPEYYTKYWFHITKEMAVKLAKYHKSKLEEGAKL